MSSGGAAMFILIEVLEAARLTPYPGMGCVKFKVVNRASWVLAWLL